MADFKTVLNKANEGYHQRDDYPPYALASWDDRNRWSQYLSKINDELNDGKSSELELLEQINAKLESMIKGV